MGPVVWCSDGTVEDARSYTVDWIRKDAGGNWVDFDPAKGDPEQQVWGWISHDPPVQKRVASIPKTESATGTTEVFFGETVLKAENTKQVSEKPGVGAGENGLSSGGSAASISNAASSYNQRPALPPISSASTCSSISNMASSYQRPALPPRPPASTCSCCKESRPWCSAKLVTCSCYAVTK